MAVAPFRATFHLWADSFAGLTLITLGRAWLPEALRLGFLLLAVLPTTIATNVAYTAQKTLAAGAPLAKLIFAAHPELSLILLPIMLYHPLQLLAGGLIIHLDRASRR
jgi:predicted Na+-dependent transporter